MTLKEKFAKFVKDYNHAGNIFNKVIIIIFILCAGAAIIIALNPQQNQNQITISDNISPGTLIECPQTVAELLEQTTISDINVVDKISTIDYSTEVLQGPNQKNLIPPVTKPQFFSYKQMGACLPDDRTVVTVTTDNITRVYPLAILDYHIVINDIVGNTPIAVIYTPTSAIINVFDTTVKAKRLIFGHTGSLYKNTDLLVDFSTDTLWSAKTGEAMVGIMAGAKLKPVNFKVMNYGKAKTEYPEAQVISFGTGFRRNYGIDPFVKYKNNNVIPQETSNQSTSLPIKEIVLGFNYKNQNYALSITKLKQQTPYTATLNGNDKLTAIYSGGEFIISIESSGVLTQIKFDQMYWFVWYDYYPDTIVI